MTLELTDTDRLTLSETALSAAGLEVLSERFGLPRLTLSETALSAAGQRAGQRQGSACRLTLSETALSAARHGCRPSHPSSPPDAFRNGAVCGSVYVKKRARWVNRLTLSETALSAA